MRTRRSEAVRLRLAAVAVVVTLPLLLAMNVRNAPLLAAITILAGLLRMAALHEGPA